MKLLSPDRMKQYDDYGIRTWGIPSPVLMENAGRAAYRLMKQKYLTGVQRVAVVCGRGNNGGDGFVIARYALRDGFATQVFLLGDAGGVKGDAKLNMDLYTRLGGQIVTVTAEKATDLSGLAAFDLIVDAIFGTGLSKEVGGVERQAIDEINRAGKTVVSVDIPSGLDGRTGRPLGAAVRADATYTFAYPKLGCVLFPGAAYVGNLTVVDISLPCSAEREIGFEAELLDGALMRQIIRERLPWEHKGSFGHVAVIAGSTGKTGAAAMSSEAALRIGAGLVTLLCPGSLNGIMEVKLTEVMTYPVEDGGRGFFPLSAYEEIAHFVEDKDVIVIGPGLSAQDETRALVRKVFTEIDKPFVVDADGINSFQGHPDLLSRRGPKAVFTPHPGEFARLVGSDAATVNQQAMEMGQRFAKEHGVHLVLKGARTWIFGPSGGAFLNITGNPGLAKGGSGDILTGFLGGLAGQGYSLLDAALLAVYLHGYIADDWAVQRSNLDLLATDLLGGVAGAIRAIRHGTDRVYIEKSL